MSMSTYDDKVQMMDAGMAYYQSGNTFSDEIKRIEGIMAENGFPGRKTDVSKDANGDLFMDYSNSLRHRYIRCHLDDCGDGKFAVNIYEGNRNMPMRVAIILVCFAIMVIPAILYFDTLCAIAWIAIFSWICAKVLRPSELAQDNVSNILSRIKMK